jgi:putative nucleotidyltransferase with HDIG domain
MLGAKKPGARRAEIRKNRPDAGVTVLSKLRAEGGLFSIGVAAFFFICASGILVLRENVIPYRPGQWTHHDIVSRVDFDYRDDKRLQAAREAARQSTPRVYKQAEPSPWKVIEDSLLSLPDRVKGLSLEELPKDIKPFLDSGSLNKLQEAQLGTQRRTYEQAVHAYIKGITDLGIVVIPEDDYQADLGRWISITGRQNLITTISANTPKRLADIRPRLEKLASDSFQLVLQPKIVEMTLAMISPTHTLDDVATANAQSMAEAAVSLSTGNVTKAANVPLVDVDQPAGGEIRQEDWLLLRAENDRYLASLGPAIWGQRAGLAGMVLLMTIVICAYISLYQPRIVRNHMRAMAIALLLLSMLLTAELAALGTSSLYFFGVAPTILVAMILTIAYDQRFALAMATFHAVLVTLALNEDMGFLAILVSGLVTCCFMLDDLRTRSKLIEVGGATALAMIAATAAAGLLRFDPAQFIARNCLYAGAAGLGVGFVVLGILPFIEKAFRITTSMTLLELADASQPLLRRLSLEAPGTYNHSLQVATLAEEAAEAIGANSLLCRVASYYHDVGKINKAEYFVENQIDGHNRHINLSPNVSLLIIIGHVKDGIELAREYNLPTSLFPFIQQHHGTTLVEYFYQRACNKTAPDQPDVEETQFRYPGPKPRTREIAILMLCDAVESACRAMSEPNPSRIETIVHDITMRRLQDGQFDECDLTMRDLDMIERSLVKTLLGIYHGRIAYPSTAAIGAATDAAPAAKTA